MSEQLAPPGAAVDFAVVAYREDGAWMLAEFPAERALSLEAFTNELRRWPGETGTLGLASYDEDFFLVLRVQGARVRVLLSDVTAATEWEIAREALELLDLPDPDDDDVPAPAGDLGIVADMGLTARDMGALLDDLDAYPDEMLSDIAGRIGFGGQFDELVGAS